ncbi:hypothetical protein SH580_13930 [Coraliomargarita algicola]|uniref:Tetratricopeptide repeat protein n=1 Tax=Coraliomargarita algicola TaxID=3092156 RepID=A0ABZ0RGJ2_9BACT|nr:hypothetical protein [Coraliomargarita sp. J2-16]WPJ94531.1 hypothetical protein SH580_13930 [Coraliomargarita sp. J2-16]
MIKLSFAISLGGLFGMTLLPLAHACGPWLPDSYILRNDDVFYAAPKLGFGVELRHLLSDTVPHEAQLDSEPLGGMSSQEALASSLRVAGVVGAEADVVLAAYANFRKHLNRAKDRDGSAKRYDYSVQSDADSEEFEPIALEMLEVPSALPDEFRCYLQGALAYYRNDLAAALDHWQAVLALPEAERQQRSVMAAYMIGRACPDRALSYFPMVRELVDAGFPDPDGLAAASYGWQARVHMDQGQFQEAIDLYLQQWAAGYWNAEQSLKRVARDVWNYADNQKLQDLIQNDASRAVLTAYLLVQRDDAETAELRARFLEALPDLEAISLPEAGRFALMEYQLNHLSAARLWISHAAPSDALALWVKSKLLLRAGRIAEGRTLMLALTETMQSQGEVWRRLNTSRAWGELGLLMLREERFVEAADCFWNARSWEDCAYVLERLLSIDELISWVDAHPVEMDLELSYQDGASQSLLARRLMREGRFDLALQYFQPAARVHAEAYLQAMRSASDASQEVLARAQHYWEAAYLMREYGMLLFAAELAPDYAWTEGALEWGDMAHAREKRLYSMDYQINEPTGRELDRANRTQILPDKRYHYRYRAVRLAELGASLLPNNHEQAARIYCVAGSWIKYRDPSEADRLFKLLVVRCPDTELGQAATAINWFPHVDVESIQPFADDDESLLESSGVASDPCEDQ